MLTKNQLSSTTGIEDQDSEKQFLFLVECGWNKSWVPAELPKCVATVCSTIPFPPKKLQLINSQDEQNNMTFHAGKEK